MDLKLYYRKLREIAAGLDEEYVVVKSRPTADGGIEGRLTEVTRGVAAKMLADGMADVAGPDESAAFRLAVEEARKREEQRRAAAQVQFTVITGGDVRPVPNAAPPEPEG